LLNANEDAAKKRCDMLQAALATAERERDAAKAWMRKLVDQLDALEQIPDAAERDRSLRLVALVKPFFASYEPIPHPAEKQRDAALAALRTAEGALEPFANLPVGRFMNDGLKYDYRIDTAWLRRARAALAEIRKALGGKP
jgi:hypothetical protein